MGAFADWLSSKFSWLADKIHDVFILVVNALIDALATFANVVLGLLPTVSSSALPSDNLDSAVSSSGISNLYGMFNWFIPINGIIQCLTFYAAAMILYFSLGPLLRWVKIIR